MANSMPPWVRLMPWLHSAPLHVTLKILINSFNDVGGGLVTRVLGCFSAYWPGHPFFNCIWYRKLPSLAKNIMKNL